ncbi:MAG: hypothetical protein R3F65_09310 [bacterium]
MRWIVTLDGLASEGVEQVRDPWVWPVWFVVDDGTLRAVAGDVTAQGHVFAAEPLVMAAAYGVAWQREGSLRLVPRARSLVGVAVLVSAGVTEETRAVQRGVVDRLRGLTLSQAAAAAGLSALRAAYGGDAAGDAGDEVVERLRRGFDPRDEALAPWALPGLSGVMALAELMASVREAVMPAEPAPVVQRVGAPAAVRKGVVTYAQTQRGEVVAGGARAWRLDDLAAGEPVRTRLRLVAPATPRVALSVSMTLRVEV